MIVLSSNTISTTTGEKKKVDILPLILQALGPSIISKLKFKANGEIEADITTSQLSKIFQQFERNHPNYYTYDETISKGQVVQSQPRVTKPDNPPPLRLKKGVIKRMK